MNIEVLLNLLSEKEGSDLYITALAPPSMKLSGKMVAIGKKALSEQDAADLVLSTMDETQVFEFRREKELNFAILSKSNQRFRVSAFFQRSNMGMVIRRIESEIPLLEDLNLPPVLKDLSMTKRGLIIVVGATGSGKSTSLAAMIGLRNRRSRGHIITLEDPIEFVHEHQGCIITQREVGVDTESFEVGLKNTLRQAPDVILVGEVRSKETMKYALNFAETGHLCLCTLHANNANQALDRIMSFFPPAMHDQIWMDLSLNVKAIIAQQLVPKIGGGRVAVNEIMINSPLVADLVRKGSVPEIKDVMERSIEQGMQTFDRALYMKYQQGEITLDDAMAHADSSNNVRLMAKLSEEEGSSSESVSSSWEIDGDDPQG